MKHTLHIALTLLFALSIGSVQAQSLDELMKSLGSFFAPAESSTTPPKEVYPEQSELLGRFTYQTLAIAYSGDSALASLAVATLESQLPMIAERFGFVAGRDYVEAREDGTLIVVREGKKMTVYCSSYDSQSGRTTITLRTEDAAVSIGAVVSKVDGMYRLMFDAQELFALMAKHYSKFEENTTLRMIKGVVDEYPGVKVGVVLKR